MLYAILCYDSEEAVSAWSRTEESAAMDRLAAVQQKVAAQGRLGTVARLRPITTATAIRKCAQPLVTDRPFAETKEQLLGFYVVDCETSEDALDIARNLAKASSTPDVFEVRSLLQFRPGTLND